MHFCLAGFVCLSIVCLFICLPVCLSAYLSVCLSFMCVCLYSQCTLSRTFLYGWRREARSFSYSRTYTTRSTENVRVTKVRSQLAGDDGNDDDDNDNNDDNNNIDKYISKQISK